MLSVSAEQRRGRGNLQNPSRDVEWDSVPDFWQCRADTIMERRYPTPCSAFQAVWADKIAQSWPHFHKQRGTLQLSGSYYGSRTSSVVFSGLQRQWALPDPPAAATQCWTIRFLLKVNVSPGLFISSWSSWTLSGRMRAHVLSESQRLWNIQDGQLPAK